jgi:uncharacterized membrane protein
MSSKALTIAMSIFYTLAGLYHFINPVFYVGLVPESVDEKEFIIAVSGLFEIILGLFLLFRETRKIAAIAIIIMLLVFLFVVHFPMALDFFDNENPLLWFAIIRIPIQFVLIYWAFRVSKIRKESKFS